ncbi:MAG: tRNA-(ms[2]io[6]A)-hydroxylase [Pirellulaceae bacterium]|jgi:tRNA-(ms[2]io[6]A)-hydroxylase|nr:tRNA-(ms[2]io[6]A)-hydroxylase [Pirellulaceae bacterium]
MLNLHAPTPGRWLDQVTPRLDLLLIDHAHCEKKAAGVAMNLLFAYVEHADLTRAMTEIVQEELDHFHQVRAILDRRGIRFYKLPPSQYGPKLHELVSKDEPRRAVDRLLVAGLIEARSCERFGLLRDFLADRELADFYGSLFESEARHHSTYVRLAKEFLPEADVRSRLAELAAAEAAIITAGEDQPRMHS